MKPAAHELLLAAAHAADGSTEITDVIDRTISELTGLAVLSIAGIGTLLVTAKDQASLYRRVALLFGVAGLAALAAATTKTLIPKAPSKKI